MSSLTISNRIHTACGNFDIQNAGKALHWVGLQLSVPVYRSCEMFIRAQMTPITPGKNGNLDSKSAEKARRYFEKGLTILASVISGPSFLIGAGFHLAGDRITRMPYIYAQSTASNKQDNGNYSFLQLNVCMFFGGLPICFGGVSPARQRIEGVADLILRADADFVSMQEMMYDSARKIQRRIQHTYPHVFMRIGPNPNPLKLESCLFFASKYAIKGDPQFKRFPNQNGMYRGYFYVETERSIVCTTHLEPGEPKESGSIRKEQLSLVTKSLKQLKLETNKDFFLLGDLNIQRTGQDSDEYSSSGIKDDYFDAYQKKYPTFNANTATCTNVLQTRALGKPDPVVPWEIDDYALIEKGAKDKFRTSVELVQTFSLDSPEKALSDHRGLLFKAALTASK